MQHRPWTAPASIAERRRRSRRRLRAVGVSAVTVVGLGVLAPVPASAAGADQLSFGGEEGTGDFGADAAVRIDGRLTYETECPEPGVPDFVYPATDVYVTAGVPAPGATLADATGGPPNTVVATASAFLDEIIAITGPTGTLGEGVWTVVYDTCQDGIFHEGIDTAFADVLTVRLPAVLPAASAALTDLKAAADREARSWADAHTLFELIEKIQDLPDLISCMRTTDPKCLTGMLIGEATDGFSFTARVLDGFESLLLNMGRHYAAIAADPPDRRFQQVTTITPLPSAAPGTGEPLRDAMAGTLPALAGEAALAEALLHAVERYQGAQAAGDGVWALVHARQAADLATALATATDASGAGIGELRAAIEAAPQDVDGAHEQARTYVERVWARGFTADERQALRNAGLTPAQIAERETRTRQAHPLGRITRAGILARLDEVTAAHAATRSALASTAAAFAQIAEKIAARPAFAAAVPIAVAGGPYAAVAGASLALDGSASAGPAGDPITAHDWDTDGDGAFDDATGATASAPAAAPVVGLRVTTGSGARAVSYAVVDLAPAARPLITDATPDTRSVIATVGERADFAVTADGAVSWHRDGTAVGEGNTFGWTPEAAEVGEHVLDARLPGGAVRRWHVLVLARDGDGDGWTATPDCDDSTAATSPGTYERIGNGVDDDCDTGTPDAPPGGLTGTPWTWGMAVHGALGRPGVYSRLPGELTGYDDVTSVENAHVGGYALRADGRVLAWGRDANGQLGNGDGSMEPATSPVSVVGVDGATPELTGVTQVTFGQIGPHTVARRSDGSVVAWGGNMYRQLGDGSTASSKSYPVRVLRADGEPLTGVRAVEAGSQMTYALMDDGTVEVWGTTWCSGGVGRQVPHPEPISSLGTTVRQVAAGYHWTAFLRNDGAVLTCGNSNALGRRPSATEPATAPHPVVGLGAGSGVVDVSAGYESGVALKADGTVWMWGWSGNGSMAAAGVPSSGSQSAVQVPLPPGPPVIDVENSEACHTQALRADGSILVWGCDTHGSTGILPPGTLTEPTLLDLPAAAVATSSSIWNGMALARPLDDAWERPAFWVRASVADAAGTEGAPGLFEVTLSEPLRHDVSVDWTVVPGTAGDDDLHLAGGTVTVPAGQTSAAIPAPVVDDALHEGDEAYTVGLTGISHGLTVDRAQATGTVTDDDAAPEVSVEPLTVAEGDTSLTDAAVAVRLSAPSALPVSVDVSTADGTATAPGDYATAGLRVAVPAGATEALAHVAVHGDTEVEATETFVVRLSAPSGATLGSAEATVTVTDDEPLALRVSSPAVAEGDGGSTAAVFAVTLDPPPPAGTTVTVPWSLSSGTADVPGDVADASGTLAFTGGAATLEVTAQVVGDDATETTEFFRLLLGDAVASDGRLVLPADAALATIDDDDAVPAWPFEGFFPPVRNPPAVNAVQAGRTIPLMFGLGGDRGLDIFADGFPASRTVPCAGSGANGELEPIGAPGSSSLTYATGNDRYHLNWQTRRDWGGTCRELVLRFVDGQEATAVFRFR